MTLYDRFQSAAVVGNQPPEDVFGMSTGRGLAENLHRRDRLRLEIGMRDHAVVQLNVETELRRAVEHNELHLVFQPVVALISGALSGFEVLLRWPALVPTISTNNGRVGVIIDGYLMRASQ